MKKTLYLSLFLLLVLSGCETQKKPETKTSATSSIQESEGYKLMEQKCFICHFPAPNPDKKDEMIAPPMLRIQEHYKPAYSDKKAFVQAIKSWVTNPTIEKAQMPGAVRKFDLMPHLAYTEEDISLIAETLYDVDLGNTTNMHKNEQLTLNHGKKWKLEDETLTKVQSIIEKLNSFQSDDIAAYNDLGKEIFGVAKNILINKTEATGQTTQLQIFFHSIEDDMHQLMQVKTVKEGDQLLEKINKKFKKFLNYFE